MIKINLSASKKKSSISNVGGFDFTKVKFVAVIFVIIIIAVSDSVLGDYWTTQVEEAETAVAQKNIELNNLKKKVSKSQDLEKQIQDLKVQEDNLGKKLTAVKQAISEKRNPASLLLYIAKNIPQELWIKDLEITQEQMTLKGEALDYTSIGSFVNSLKSSIFIRDANIVGTTSIVRESDKRRIETFEVKFGIARFDQ